MDMKKVTWTDEYAQLAGKIWGAMIGWRVTMCRWYYQQTHVLIKQKFYSHEWQGTYWVPTVPYRKATASPHKNQRQQSTCSDKKVKAKGIAL